MDYELALNKLAALMDLTHPENESLYRRALAVKENPFEAVILVNCGLAVARSFAEGVVAIAERVPER